ncbi:hypothetical protein ON010_g4593 [Phytophthora cinnamomi]|nr:hypothetical protein ON010_g4593 [Phytophthora cinnamomi]
MLSNPHVEAAIEDEGQGLSPSSRGCCASSRPGASWSIVSRYRETLSFLLRPTRSAWTEIVGRDWAQPLMDATPQCVDWSVLSDREYAFELLVKKHLDRADWRKLSSHDWALDALMAHPGRSLVGRGVEGGLGRDCSAALGSEADGAMTRCCRLESVPKVFVGF